jgi:hypothetical protein
MIILPHGALVLEESRKTPLALREDAIATYSESGLPKCNARHRRKRRAGTRCSPSERGITVRQGVVPLRKALPDILSSNTHALSPR